MFHTIALEVSLKPFKKTDSAYIKSVISQIFQQWTPLLKNRKVIQIMLWAADGSEILDYKGNLDDVFEWGKFIGNANNPTEDNKDPFSATGYKQTILYMDDPPVMTYRVLKEIISELKAEGARRFPGTVIQVGETFDIGPEFAYSSFKYVRHNEICSGGVIADDTFLNSHAVLDGDDYPYAGFPNGIPDKTPFGTFLGRQTKVFFDDLGFDFLWLSNGVGFSAFPWSTTGPIFDGEQFYPEKLKDESDRIFSFWEYFRKECPDYPLEARGTNFSVGIDYASDGVPLHALYNADLNVLPPPNSPWASINSNFGIELMGHMTRVSELPGNDFLFRYYIHDPWFHNTPWYDRYEGQPHDIYMPMALSRLDEAGTARPATAMSILSIDNSFGNMPDSCVNEPMPHILKAEKDAADAPSPLVWVYPMREYTTTQDVAVLRQMMAGDGFIGEAINNGLPLSTVVSCDNFLLHDTAIYQKSVLITPVPEADSAFETAILDYIEKQGKVLFYGPLTKAGKRFLELFALRSAPDVSGQLAMDIAYYPDIHSDGRYPKEIFVRPENSAGALDAIAGTDIMHTVNGYTLAAKYENAVWFRAPIGGTGHGYIEPDLASEYVKGEVLFRRLLEEFGYSIRFAKPDADAKTPVIMLSRSNNALIFSTFSPCTAVETRLKFPLGAPILDGYDAHLIDGAAAYHFPRSCHKECRVFVEQESGIVSVHEEIPQISDASKRRICVKGLKNATVRFFGETASQETVTAQLNPESVYATNSDDFAWEIVRSAEYGTYFEARNVTGDMLFNMNYPNK